MITSFISKLAPLAITVAIFSYMLEDHVNEFRREFIHDSRASIEEIKWSALEVPHDFKEAKLELEYLWEASSNRVTVELKILGEHYISRHSPRQIASLQ